MATPTSGPISFADVNIALGRSANATISLNDAIVRALPPKASGTISMSDLRGKPNAPTFQYLMNGIFGYSAGFGDFNLREWITTNGSADTGLIWDGTSAIVVTITNLCNFYGTNASKPAMTISGSFPNGLKIINGAKIYGAGGNGGAGGSASNNGSGIFANKGSDGGAGGTAIFVSTTAPITIDNVTLGGTIAGGGGGGGGGGGAYGASAGSTTTGAAGGGGGGGGAGGYGSSGGGVGGAGGTGAATVASNGKTAYNGTDAAQGYGRGGGLSVFPNNGGFVQGGAGEWGGNLGEAGTAGYNGSDLAAPTRGAGGAGGLGGRAGYYIQNIALVTFLGGQGNVKGLTI